MSSPDFIIIGGGIVGLATALELKHAGLEVSILEQDACGGGASSAAAGLLEPFAEPDLPHSLREAALGSLALWEEWLRDLESKIGRSLEFSERGTLIVAMGAEDEEFRERIAANAEESAVPSQWLTTERLAQKLPWLTQDPTGAVLHLTSARRVDNVEVCAALVTACRSSGVQILEKCKVLGVRLLESAVRVETEDWAGEAAGALLAAGCWSGGIPGLPTLPVRPRRGQLVAWDGCTWEWDGCVRCGRRYILRRGKDRLIVGSTVEDVGFAAETTPEATAMLTQFAIRLVPSLQGREPATAWAGLRPGSADDLPLVGRWSESRLWVATGHFRNGILLAPWTAATLTQQILADAPADSEAPFSPMRFAARH